MAINTMAIPPLCLKSIIARRGIASVRASHHPLHQHRKSADVRFGSTDKVELVDIERKTARIFLQGSQRLLFHGS